MSAVDIHALDHLDGFGCTDAAGFPATSGDHGRSGVRQLHPRIASKTAECVSVIVNVRSLEGD